MGKAQKTVDIKIAVTTEGDTIRVVFSEPVNYLQMSGVSAIRFGELLKERGITTLRAQ
jgi:hypothetical protein